MKIYLDCLPCFMRQCLEASRLVTNDESVHKKLLIEAAKIVAQVDDFQSAPEVGRAIHSLIKKFTGNKDPYEDMKKACIEAAEQLYPNIKMYLYGKKDRLYYALKISAVGNMLDAAVYGTAYIRGDIVEELEKDFSICDIEKLREKISRGGLLLIIGDNAGETVFDRILVEELLHLDIVYAVRSNPIINDATIKEAYESGLASGTKIISIGCDAPGTILSECSEEFLSYYNKADIVISKGQGNYESLSDEGRGIFFLLKAKCPIIAQNIEVEVNDYVLVQK